MQLSRNKILLIVMILFAVGFALYAPNLRNGLFWDDDDWIVNNPSVHQLTLHNLGFIFSHDTLAGIGLRSNYYRPALFVSFMANYLIGGIRPLGYHLVNNLIHIANAIVIFVLLNYFLRRRLTAFLASLLFLIHPLQTEAVAYISGRGDPLSVFFMLLALVAFFKSRGLKLLRPDNSQPRPPSQQTIPLSPIKPNYWRWLAAALFLQILAILSRETAFLFPIYLIIFLVAFYYQEPFFRSLKRAIIQTIPFLAASIIYGILRLTVLNFQNTLNFFRQSNAYTQHLTYRVYTFLHVITVYLRLIFWPRRLHMERDVAVNASVLQWPAWLGLLIVVSILVILSWLYKKRNQQFTLWFFAWGFFFLNLAPTSGVFPINGLIYEHWLYFSLFGFFALAAFYLDLLIEFLRKHSRAGLYLTVIVLLGWGAFLGRQTIGRNVIWGKTEDFYQDILNYEPGNVRVLNNLANYYSDRGRLGDAEGLLRRAIAANDIQAAPYYNLGNLLRDKGDNVAALELYKKSIQIDPGFIYGYLNAAAVSAKTGNLTSTLDYLQGALKIEPENARLYFNIGQVQYALKRYEEALKAMQSALRYGSNDSAVEKAVNQFLAGIKYKAK